VGGLGFGTPGGLKCLKTLGTEAGHSTGVMGRMGLGRPDVRCVLGRDGKTRLDMPPASGLKDRVLEVMGRDVYDVLYPTHEYPPVNGVVASGYFSKPGHQQRTASNVYTFVNGRYVSDSTIRAAIRGAYGTLMEKGRHPSVVLFLDVPHDMVDINVHPAKIEVRFHDTNAIYRSVYHAIADALAEAPWVKREVRTYKLQPYTQREGAEGPDAASAGGLEGPPNTVRHVGPQMARFEPMGVKQRRLSELEQGKLKTSRVDYRDPQDPYYAQNNQPAPEPRQQGFSARGAQPLVEPDVLRADPQSLIAGRELAAGEEPQAANVAREGQGGYFSALRVIGQFKRQYIVCEDASGLVVIDQHAAHERIGFERLKKIFATEHKETQPLLFPKRLELSAIRAEVLAEHMEFFSQSGFEIEHFGGQTYVLKAVPAIFQKANIDKIVRDAIDDIAQSGRSSRLDEAMEAVLSRMACHSVVRGPTALTDEECYALLEQMDQIDFAANCPHGRPVYFRMSLHEIEESFDRR